MENEEIHFYAAYSKSTDVVYNSSSGGVFYEICRWVITQGGIVYGVVQEDVFNVVHKRAESIQDVKEFRKSKYVRSKLGESFVDVEQDLKNNKIVLFSGTGCQIAGLYKYLDDKYDNLYTVEVVCHGVPLMEAFRKYVLEKSAIHNAKLSKIDFRDKRYGWKQNSTCEFYENGEYDIYLSKNHPHHSIYVKGINMETGCGQCPFATLPRIADVTLADFWGYKGILEEQNKNSGISLIVTKGFKGDKLYRNIKTEIYYDQVTRNMASGSCWHLEHAPLVHVSQEAFHELIRETSFKQAYELCTQFGDVILSSQVCRMQLEDVDYVIRSLQEDRQQTIYYMRDNGEIEGIVTFGAFVRTYFEGKKWVNKDFKSVCLNDDECINKIKIIFKKNKKINRIPITNANGRFLYEVRRTSYTSGLENEGGLILPFKKLIERKNKCYFYKRPDLLVDFAYSEKEQNRIHNHWSFPVMSENLEKYGKDLQSILKHNYSEEYIEDLQRIPPIIKRGKRYQHADGYSRLVNVIGGWRKVCFQPEVYKFTIHVYGRCGVFGYAVEDADTLPSRLQRKVQGMNIRVMSHSTWGATDEYVIQNLREDLQEGVIGEKDVVLCYMNELPFMNELRQMGVYIDDTTLVFHQTLKNGDVEFFDIPGHMNAAGYEFIADYIYNDLKGDLEVQLIRRNQTECLKYAKHGCVLNIEQEKEIEKYINMIKMQTPIENEKKEIGAVVMNCNPFTNGHRYLVETALKEVDFLYVFIVEEDRSEFAFKDRINMVRLGVQDIDNIVVIPSGKYMASVYTLPDYFFRKEQKQKMIDMTLDVQIFSQYIASALHITKRFLGTEPEDAVTYEYNKTIKKIMSLYNITVREIERLRIEEKIISAKTVRKLISTRNEKELRDFVPESVLEYLKENYF